MLMDSVWILGCVNIRWVQEELQQRSLHAEAVDCSVQKEREIVTASPHAVEKETNSFNATVKKKKTVMEATKKTPESDTSVAVAIAASLKACAKQKDLSNGIKLHIDALERGLLHSNVFVGSALVSMYIKCGAHDKAQEVFDGLHTRNVVSWNALIAGYAQHGHSQKAVRCFEQMQYNGVMPDKVSFACALKACASLRALDKGRAMHAEIKKNHHLEREIVVGTALIHMYGKCGELESAQEVFDKLPHRNLISWNSLISGYAENGHGEEALHFFERMKHEHLSPDEASFVSALKACSNIGDSNKGQDLHGQIIRERLLEKSSVLANALVDMYAKCGDFSRAQEALDQLPVKNLVSWTSLISGYVQHGYGEQALRCYERMQRESVTPDAITFACILKACGSLGDLERGQEIHAQIKREHLHEKYLVVANALVSMYAKCGALEKAKEVFDELFSQDIVSWNTLIAGYGDHGYGAEALNSFEQMQIKGFSPNAITYACILKACGSIGALDKGENIHAQIVKEKILRYDVMVGSALVDMYAKCGALDKAQEVFDALPMRNLVSWNVIIAGYSQMEHYELVLKCFQEMQRDGFSPNAVTFACIVKACGCIGAAYKGQQIHSEIVKHGSLEKGNVVAVELVLMYSRCGMLAEAHELFINLPTRNEITWSAIMVGFAQLGKVEVVLRLFDTMIEEDVIPNLAIFTIVLNACSHLGLLDKGELYFKSLSQDYGFIPTLEHHTCMIDLFGRAGLIDQSVALIDVIPLFVDLTIWLVLLGGCQKMGNKGLMRWAFQNAVQSSEKDASAYVHMHNLFGSGRWQEDSEQEDDLSSHSGKQIAGVGGLSNI